MDMTPHFHLHGLRRDTPVDQRVVDAMIRAARALRHPASRIMRGWERSAVEKALSRSRPRWCRPARSCGLQVRPVDQPRAEGRGQFYKTRGKHLIT